MLLQAHTLRHTLDVLTCAGSSVAAGAVNCEGRIVVRAERCGAATALADIVHAVEAAQARAAPVQRLADRVAGGFAVGVLALSSATFAFWAAAGPRLFPQARLACNSILIDALISILRQAGGQVSPACGTGPCTLSIHLRVVCADIREGGAWP